MKTYIGTKIIKAEPMDEVAFRCEKEGRPLPEMYESQSGYKVMYPDGYISWSPKEQFEIAYREVTQSEKELI